MTPPTITCPRCRRVSAHPTDVEQGYCGNCHAFTGDELPSWPTSAPLCPSCNQPAILVLAGGHQAFCGNTASCEVIMWDPAIAPEDQVAMVVNVEDGVRVEANLTDGPDGLRLDGLTGRAETP